MKRSGLGRGLDALLPPAEVTGGPEASALREISVDRVHPSPRQPRRSFDDAGIEELAGSIRQLGILQPLIVRPMGGGYELVAGERRLRAAQRAGLDRVPALVIETDNQGALERALVENIHRSDLNPIEEAAAYRQLMDDAGLTQEALAARLGRSRVTITNTLRLLDLPVSVQRLLGERRLTPAHAKSLLSLSGNPFLERAARRAADEGLSVRETREQVRRYEALVAGAASTGSANRNRDALSPVISEGRRALSDGLQTRVRIEMGKRKGRIVIDFVSVEELERLLGVMLAGTSVRSTTVSLD
jgi:ParB family transcriptional regulator, chromosome partitioning protein